MNTDYLVDNPGKTRFLLYITYKGTFQVFQDFAVAMHGHWGENQMPTFAHESALFVIFKGRDQEVNVK